MHNPILTELLAQKQQDMRNQIYHYTQVEFCYNSNHIEGSALSSYQTNQIFERNTISPEKKDITLKIDDILEAKNHFRAFDFILESAFDTIDTKYIKELHAIMKQNCSNISVIGDFKKHQNFVGNTKTTPPHLVADEIMSLLESYNATPLQDFNAIVDFHYHFEKIHPFEDGNGRVGRLIMFKECLKHNVVPFIIDEYHRMFYYRGLQAYPNIKGYLLDTCLSCQDKYKDTLQRLGISYQENSKQVVSHTNNNKPNKPKPRKR